MGRDHLEGVDINRRIILKLFLKKWDIEWIHLVQGGDQWQAPVNAV
jgi:hypothetical protein